MSFLLSSVYESPRSEHAIKVPVKDPNNEIDHLLVDANGSRLHAWRVNLESQNQDYLSFSHHLDFQSDIKALTLLKKSNNHVMLVALLEDSLELLDVSPSEFIPRTRVPFSSVSGHLDSLEIDSILLTCSCGGQNFVVLYKYTGFITIFNPDALLEKTTSRKRPRKQLPGSKTFSIGNVVVTSMAISEESDTPTVAVLFRDIDFKLSLRYFTFSPELDTFSVVGQMDHFQGAASRLITVANGFVVASDLMFWFFPLPGSTVKIADGVKTSPQYKLKEDTRNNTVILNVWRRKQKAFGSSFSASTRIESTKIDEDRFLLVSDQGDAVILLVSTTSTQSAVAVNDFCICDMGKSTIATSLTHIKDNVFYAASRNSRSILFRVIRGMPSIDILSFMSNASPILHTAVMKNKHANTLLLSRGGYYSGELEIVNGSPYKVELINHTEIHVDPRWITTLKTDYTEMVFVEDHDEESFNVYDPCRLSESGISGVELEIITRRRDLDLKAEVNAFTAGDINCWKVSDTKRLEVGQSRGETTITLRSKDKNFEDFTQESTIAVEGLDQISCIDWFEEEDAVRVYIVSWNGKLFDVLFTPNKATLIGQITTDLQGKTSMKKYTYTSSRYSIVIADGEGLVFHVPVLAGLESDIRWELDNAQYFSAKASCGTFQLHLSSTGDVLVYDSHSISRLHESSDYSGSLRLTYLHTFEERVKICDLTDWKDTSKILLVCFDDQTMSSYKVTDTRGLYDTYHDTGLIVRCLKVSERHVAVLQVQRKVNISTSEMEMHAKLLLMNSQTLKVSDSHSFSEPVKSFDFCLIDEEYTQEKIPYIVVARSPVNSGKLLDVFCVRSNKLQSKWNVPINGTLPDPFSFSRIASHKNTVCLVGDSCCTMKLYVERRSSKEGWQAEIIKNDKATYFGADVDGNDDFWVVADAARGLFVTSHSKKRLRSVPGPFSSLFATAVAAFRKTCGFVCGDSDGNIWAALKSGPCKKCKRTNDFCDQCFNPLFQTSVGEQINDITILSEEPLSILVATVKGNVYRVMDIEAHAHARDYFLKEAETRAADEQSLTKRAKSFREKTSNVIDGRDHSVFNVKHNSGQSETLQVEVAKLRCAIGLL